MIQGDSYRLKQKRKAGVLSLSKGIGHSVAGLAGDTPAREEQKNR